MSKAVSTTICKFDTMSNLQAEIKKIINFMPNMDVKTVKWINEQHQKIGIRARLLVENAINIGMVLCSVQNKNSREFVRWIESNFEFTVKTAYRYILLFTYKDKIKEVENLTEAYKITNKFITKKKEKEEKKAERRVATYEKTGVKPKNWRRGTDDKKVKEKETKTAKEEKKETTKKPKNDDSETKKDEDTNNAENEKKKDDIDIEIEEFIESVEGFISELANKSFKLVACKRIIEKCKSMMDALV